MDHLQKKGPKRDARASNSVGLKNAIGAVSADYRRRRTLISGYVNSGQVLQLQTFANMPQT